MTRYADIPRRIRPGAVVADPDPGSAGGQSLQGLQNRHDPLLHNGPRRTRCPN